MTRKTFSAPLAAAVALVLTLSLGGYVTRADDKKPAAGKD